jgi:hypothetical protein
MQKYRAPSKTPETVALLELGEPPFSEEGSKEAVPETFQPASAAPSYILRPSLQAGEFQPSTHIQGNIKQDKHLYNEATSSSIQKKHIEVSLLLTVSKSSSNDKLGAQLREPDPASKRHGSKYPTSTQIPRNHQKIPTP